VYYPVPLHLQKCFSFLKYKERDFPEAERASDQTLALPVYPELSAAQQEYVVDRIQLFLRK
jgi:dTDP-4-amino-4,6-dideoxygalactose transaminase